MSEAHISDEMHTEILSNCNYKQNMST